MAQNSAIEWTDATWNPIRGCSVISPGCKNCYAMKQAHRFSGKGQPYEGLTQLTKGAGPDGKKTKNPVWTGKMQFVEKHLLDPLKWKDPRRIFVNSMSDLFHEGVTDEQLDQVFAVMALSPKHTFQVLTKRPERMLAWFTRPNDPAYTKTLSNTSAWYVWKQADRIQLRFAKGRSPISPFRWTEYEENDSVAPWPLPNVWLGVSVESQKYADERIPLLLQTPAAVRWVSAEPLLGPVKLNKYAAAYTPGPQNTGVLPGINWLVAGGESGPGARPMHPDWARSLRDQCIAAVVPFFFKQWGEYALGALNDNWDAVANDDNLRVDDPNLNVAQVTRVGKKAAGRLLDGKEWNQYPEAK